MDGPNIYRLFTETDCLTAQSNLKDICRYLRFFKHEDSYQAHLKKYLPKLAKPEYKKEFNEFIKDLESAELAKSLTDSLEALEPKEPEVTLVSTDTVEVVLPTAKKKGKKSKVI